MHEECLDHLILFSRERLRYVLSEYLKYDHHERIHQGINKIIEPQHEGNQGEIICIERLADGWNPATAKRRDNPLPYSSARDSARPDRPGHQRR